MVGARGWGSGVDVLSFFLETGGKSKLWNYGRRHLCPGAEAEGEGAQRHSIWLSSVVLPIHTYVEEITRAKRQSVS